MSAVPDSPPATVPPRPAANADSGSRLAHGAFWIMTRRVTLVAAGVDLAFIGLFLLLDSPFLAWLNIASIAVYAVAYWMLTRHINMPAVALIWFEVLGHAAVGTMLVGWDSGFHYYLLMFIPAIVVSGDRKRMVFLLMLLFAYYLGLHAASRWMGVMAPLSGTGLWIVHSFNVAIVFAMASYTARFYYGTVRRAEKKLVEFATRDSLTGLSNRRNLLSLAEHEIARARRTGEPIALVIADIDHFKQINDQHGHEAGDHVLSRVGALLMQLCRGQDIVARWGGEEFLLLLPATDIAAATTLAERIRESVASAAIDHAGKRVSFTLSLGVAVLSLDEELSTAIARADSLLYQSKAQGRDRVTVAG
jgi:diguanylate cyclase